MSKICLASFVIAVFAAMSAGQSLNAVENELLAHFARLAKASNYGGNSDYDVLSDENKSIRAAFLKYGKRRDVLTYAFPRLRDKLFITTSADGKLRTYSWDSEEGGTMHDFYTVYQFKGKSGTVHSWAEPFTESLEFRDAGTFVTEIFQTPSSAGMIYLATSTFIGSTSLAGQFIDAMKIDGERLNRDPKVIRTRSGLTSSINFEYDFFSVVDHPERPVKLVFYDKAKSEFRFPVVIADEKTGVGEVTDKFITYRFNGRYFVKVS